MTPVEKVNQSIVEHVDFIQGAFAGQGGTLHVLARKVADAFQRNGRLWLAGSGPMSAAAHLVSNLFLHRLTLERPPLPAIALGQDAVLASTLEREGEGRQVLFRQLRTMANPRDLLLVFGTIGSDPAAEEVLEGGRQMELVTATVYPQGSRLAQAATDFSYVLDTKSMARAIEGSIFFGQLLCTLVEGELFGV